MGRGAGLLRRPFGLPFAAGWGSGGELRGFTVRRHGASVCFRGGDLASGCRRRRSDRLGRHCGARAGWPLDHRSLGIGRPAHSGRVSHGARSGLGRRRAPRDGTAAGSGRTGRPGGNRAVVLLAVVARSLLGFVWQAVWGSTASTPLAWVVGAAVHLLLLVIAFFALYTVVPHGNRNARAALTGAIAATVLVLIARAFFVGVLDRFWASFELIYGPLTLAALLLTWGWFLGLIILFGGSLASHAKVIVIEGRSPSEAERRHVARKAGV